MVDHPDAQNIARCKEAEGQFSKLQLGNFRTLFLVDQWISESASGTEGPATLLRASKTGITTGAGKRVCDKVLLMHQPFHQVSFHSLMAVVDIHVPVIRLFYPESREPVNRCSNDLRCSSDNLVR